MSAFGEYIAHYKKTFSLAYPVCLSQLGQMTVGIVDTAMVGRLGTVPLAAVSIASSIFMVVLVFGLGVSYGMTPLVAEADGNKEEATNAMILKHAFLINMLAGILLFVFLYLLSPVIHHLHQADNVVALAVPFLGVLMLSMIPLFFFQTFKQFAEGLSLTKVAMVITILTNVLNIILNYVLIFGKWGVAPMGIMGSCWATFISRVFMAIAMFGYVFYGKRFQVYWQDFHFRGFSMDLIRKILGIGIPVGLQAVFEVGTFAFAAIMIGWIGAKELAAHQIALTLAATSYMVASGIGAAATVRVGNQLGLKSAVNMRRAGFSAFHIVITFMLFSATMFIVFRHALPLIFNKNAGVDNIASSLLVITAFFQLSDGMQVVGLGALRGLKDVKIPTFITLIAYWLLGLPSGYILGFKFHLGVQGVWYGLLIGLSAAALLLFWRFNYVSRKAIV